MGQATDGQERKAFWHKLNEGIAIALVGCISTECLC
jgi:hypothetical protein